MKCLYRLTFDCGRMGVLHGLFAATQHEVDAAMGREVYFGEVLGKHSEIYGPLAPSDLQRIDVDSSLVESLSAVLGDTWSGYNPLRYLREDDEDGEDS